MKYYILTFTFLSTIASASQSAHLSGQDAEDLFVSLSKDILLTVHQTADNRVLGKEVNKVVYIKMEGSWEDDCRTWIYDKQTCSVDSVGSYLCTIGKSLETRNCYDPR